MIGNQFINLKTGWNKRKDSRLYPAFSVWTLSDSNQMVDEGKCHLIKLFLANKGKQNDII